MSNKGYSDEFLYEYTPKQYKNESDPNRDLSSYSKPASRKEPTRTRTSSAPAPRRNSSGSAHTWMPAKLEGGSKIFKGVFNKYGEICMAGLGNIIKVIAFIVAFGIIIACLALGIMLFSARSGLSALSLLVIIAGVVLAALFFFPIYGIGHMICQNNEILRIFTNETSDN